MTDSLAHAISDGVGLAMHRTSARAAMLAFLLALAVPVDAQIRPPLPLPPPPAPPLPTGNVQRALGGAFGAIVGASATNPAAAQQANFLYQSALQNYRAGDFAAAAAEANAAHGIAGAATAGLPRATIQPPPQNGLPALGQALPAAPAPVAALSEDLLRARNEIDLAAEWDGPKLEEAKRHYRAALDAYLDGNRAKERREANASYDLAEQVLEYPPKPTP